MATIDWTAKVPDLITEVGIPVFVALVGLAGSVFVAALSFAMGRWAEAAGRRRDGYSAAKRSLVRYSEYCWRIRRRTSDAPDELHRLADLGHEIQEELAYQQLWTRSENSFVGRVFREVQDDLAAQLGPACNDAWTSPPITTAADMVLAGWGPRDLEPHLERFESAVAFRFGPRRLLGVVHLHLGILRRPAKDPAPAPAAVGDGSADATP